MKLPKGKPHKIDWEKAKELGKKILEDEKEPKPSEIIEKRANKLFWEYDSESAAALTQNESYIRAILEYLDTKDS